jgi:hypothetical protein
MDSMCEYTTVHYDSRPLLALRLLARVCVEYFLRKPLLCTLVEMFSKYISRGNRFSFDCTFPPCYEFHANATAVLVSSAKQHRPVASVDGQNRPVIGDHVLDSRSVPPGHA